MKVCVVTATRAEYGLLKPLMQKLKEDKAFELQILATGTHLSPEFGLTYRQIESDGFTIDYKTEMLLSSDTAEGITKTMGLCMISLAEAFKNLQSDLLIILGDRYEMLAVASTALIYKIPIAHLHGGEITEGAYDDAIRHAITKLSHLHFTSTEVYKNRVIQLGEQPETVYNVGAIGLDNIVGLDLLNKATLEKELGISFKEHNFMVAFHPETLAEQSVEAQFKELLNAIENTENCFFIFTKTNADTGGRIINQMMQDFVNQLPEKAVMFDSLGSMRFLSAVKCCDAIIGNSSSGILEAPSLGTYTINIGDRQKGRIQANSVINCICNNKDIRKAIQTVQSKEKKIQFDNPYYNGGASAKIMEVLKLVETRKMGVKKFYNL